MGAAQPPYFVNITMDAVTFVSQKIEELCADSALFLIDVKVQPTNNIKVYMDGDQGINIEACTKLNRSLYKAIEEEGLFPEGDFSLEVSSPGVDEPLKQLRQYHKNVGRSVEVTKNDQTKELGILKAVNEEAITLEKTLGKKKEILLSEIPFSDIKKTIVQITF